MNYVRVEIIDTVGLNPRERKMLQNTVLNFVAMSNALILKEDIDEPVGTQQRKYWGYPNLCQITE